MFRFSGKRRGGVFAVADVASGSVGVAIVEVREGEPAHILLSQRSTLPLEGQTSGVSTSGILAQLEDAAQKALKAYTARADKTQPHVDKAYAIIRAPWSHSRSLKAETSFPQETSVDEKTIRSLAEEALKNDTEQRKGEMYETSVVRVLLNGYPTARPTDKLARQIAVSVLVSDCEARLRSGVSETLTKVFSCPPPILRSGIRALLTTLRESAALPEDCLIVNMTSRGTGMVAVRKGAVSETATVPEGSRTIIRRVAGGKMPEETLSLLRMLMSEQCEDSACEDIQKALVAAEPALVKIFGEHLAKMSAQRRLPNEVVLAADEDITEWFAQFLSKLDFAQCTISTGPFAVRELSPKDLSKVVVDDTEKSDIGLIVASALAPLEMTKD